MGGNPATVEITPAPTSVIDLPADSLLGITRHGPSFEFSCLITGSGAAGKGDAGLIGSDCPAAILANASVMIRQGRNPIDRKARLRTCAAVLTAQWEIPAITQKPVVRSNGTFPLPARRTKKTRIDKVCDPESANVLLCSDAKWFRKGNFWAGHISKNWQVRVCCIDGHGFVQSSFVGIDVLLPRVETRK